MVVTVGVLDQQFMGPKHNFCKRNCFIKGLSGATRAVPGSTCKQGRSIWEGAGRRQHPPPLTIQRKLLVFSTYAFYLLSLVSIASLLPAIQQQHGWTTGQMIEIASMTTFGGRARLVVHCLPTAELTTSPMRRPGGG